MSRTILAAVSVVLGGWTGAGRCVNGEGQGADRGRVAALALRSRQPNHSRPGGVFLSIVGFVSIIVSLLVSGLPARSQGGEAKYRYEVGTAPAFVPGHDVFYIGGESSPAYNSGYQFTMAVGDKEVRIKTGTNVVDLDKKFKMTEEGEVEDTPEPDSPSNIVWTCSVGDIRLPNSMDWKKTVRSIDTASFIHYKPPATIEGEEVIDTIAAQPDDQWWSGKEYQPDATKGEAENSKRDDAPGTKIELKVKIVKTAPTTVSQVSAKASPLTMKEICEKSDQKTGGLGIGTAGLKYYELKVGPPLEAGSYKGFFVFESSEKLAEIKDAQGNVLKSTLTDADLDGKPLSWFYEVTSDGFIVGEKYAALYSIVPEQNDNTFWDYFANFHTKVVLKGEKGTTKALWYRHYYSCQGKVLDTGAPNKGFLGTVIVTNIDHPCALPGISALLTEVWFDDRKPD